MKKEHLQKIEILKNVNAGNISTGDINIDAQTVIHQSYYALFGNLPQQQEVDWDRAMRLLSQEMLPDIKARLEGSLYVADMDAVEVQAKRQEDSPMLALEPVKTLTSDRITAAESIDPLMPIIQAYARDDIKGKLLILGSPGAGKTITLLKLAEQLVGEAIDHPKTVIPIVFELSTWRDGQNIEDWLIEQLYENFSANPKRDRKARIYETWLEQQVLLPLMDGLDELGMVRQQSCTAKLNEFARGYPYLVVCCRVKEFQQAGVKLSNLRGKVQLQPLTDGQIRNYLKIVHKCGLWEQTQVVPEMGKLLEPVVDPERPDNDEPGLLRVPLFVALAAQVFEADRPLTNKLDLFDRYIDRQLELDRRENDRQSKRFENRKWAFKTLNAEPKWREVKHLLTWAAQHLQASNKVELLIEQIQPQWLDSSRTKRSYIVVHGLLFGLFGWLALEPIWELSLRVIVGPGLDSRTIPLTSLIGSLMGGTVSARINSLDDIKPVEGLRISRSHTAQREISRAVVKALFFSLIGGLLLAPVFGVFLGLISGLITSLRAQDAIGHGFAGLIVGIIIGGAFGSVYGLIVGLRADLKLRSKPNQGIWNSCQISFSTTVLSYPLGIFLAVIVMSLPIKLDNTMNIGRLLSVWMTIFLYSTSQSMMLGISTALLLGFFALQPVIQHSALRIILTRHYGLPWNLAQFLTYCHERRLLQQIGGRYRFIHRELLDHFAGKAEG
jgi:DNA polymerase III delta prime subunit